MPKAIKKSVKKTVKKVSVKSTVSTTTNSAEFLLGLAVVVFAIVVGPLVWYITGNVLALFVIPAIASFTVAFLYRDLVGFEMTYEFRRMVTTVVSVLAVGVALLFAVQLPRIGLNGQSDIVLPLFMVIYYSVWAIIVTLVTVFLPLGVTIPKKK